mgnify:CR=1 FL=1
MEMIFAGVFAVIIGLVIGYVSITVRMKSAKEAAELTLLNAEQEATNLRGQAEREADLLLKEVKRESKSLKKEALLEAKEEARKYREEVEAEFKSDRQELKQLESRLTERATSLDRKDDNLTNKEKTLEQKEQSISDRNKNLEARENKLTELEQHKEAELERVASLSQTEARDIILTQTEDKLSKEIATRIREAEQEVKERSDKVAKDILVQAMQRIAGDYVAEQTNSTVHLPDDTMKGRIIGREGRNIRTFESLTGIDVIIDDTPEVVTLSGFDPIRREIARMTMEALLKDGRIHPARIEEVVSKVSKQVEEEVIETGKRTAIDLGIHGLYPEFIRIVGKMKYRSSYGQNLLQHARETANLCGIMAAELGLNPKKAKRAGLLHDIGKVPDEETELPHALYGAKIAEKYKEKPDICNAIGAHHDEMEMTSLIAPIVQVCDAISGARPGARREIVEAYVKRLNDLENIAMSYPGVMKTYAIQAGRELRVIVGADKIDDKEIENLSNNIATRIQNEMTYPGQVKITVIRETRSVSYAK